MKNNQENPRHGFCVGKGHLGESQPVFKLASLFKREMRFSILVTSSLQAKGPV